MRSIVTLAVDLLLLAKLVLFFRFEERCSIVIDEPQATSAQKGPAKPTLLGKGEPPKVGETPKGLPRAPLQISPFFQLSTDQGFKGLKA